MAKFFHGAKRRGPYFEGWYFKCQTKDGRAVALIPAVHMDGAGQQSASLQVITDRRSWWLEYPEEAFRALDAVFQIQLGQNVFSSRGLWLDVERNGLSLHGVLHCGPLTLLRSDIMGPFRFLPRMECAHGVISMGHRLDGSLTLDGETLDFSGGTGYIETDRGRSFPSSYLWTQCAWGEPGSNGLMLSIASVPISGKRFTGCICAVIHGGQEYRLATYQGARTERWSGSGAVIRQGKYRLAVELLEGCGHPLQAPVEGEMGRTVHESLRAKVRYHFWAGRDLVFTHTDRYASFEYAGGPKRS